MTSQHSRTQILEKKKPTENSNTSRESEAKVSPSSERTTKTSGLSSMKLAKRLMTHTLLLAELLRVGIVITGHPEMKFACELIGARIAHENQFRSADDQLPTPHKNTIYRIVSKLDPYEKDKARFS